MEIDYRKIILRLMELAQLAIAGIVVCLLITMCLSSCTTKKSITEEHYMDSIYIMKMDSVYVDSIVRTTVSQFSSNIENIEIDEITIEWSSPDSAGNIYPVKSSIRHEKVFNEQTTAEEAENVTERKFVAKTEVVENKVEKKDKVKTKDKTSFNSEIIIIPVIVLIVIGLLYFLFLFIKGKVKVPFM